MMNNIIRTSKLVKTSEVVGADEPSQTESDLVSLISSSNSVMRTLAARNFKYYPEHLSTLLNRLAIEVDESVMMEVKNTILELAVNEPANQIIERKVREISNSKDNDELLERTCQDILSRLNN
ncbi:hypothetical protein N9L48_01470 [Psychrosphaera sp.]|nr:hypothetical protein [Psychrosphaera sp.]